MQTEDRRSYVLRLLENRPSVTVTELSAHFGVSEVSVRKLLTAMEQEGTIKRTWGGAVSTSTLLAEELENGREPAGIAEKKSIARAAYACIEDSDTIFLDCGATTIQLARLIRKGKKRNVLIATTGLNIAMELADSGDIAVIMIGGEVQPSVLSCAGAFAESMLNSMYFDKGLISGNYLTVNHGLTTPNADDARFKRIIMEHCRETYIVIDSSRFGDDSLSLIAKADELGNIITDWNVPGELLRGFENQGTHVIQSTK